MGVTRMNEECLKLKDHTAGYQTVQDIQRVVTEAIGGRAALSNEQLIDEVMVRLLPCDVVLAVLLPSTLLLSCRSSNVPILRTRACLVPSTSDVMSHC